MIARSHDDGPNPPVVLLGGAENAVACARRFVGDGIRTIVVAPRSSPVHWARGVDRRIDVDDVEGIIGVLDDLGRSVPGAVVIPLSDPALAAVASHHSAMRGILRPALLDPAVVDAMLDKERTIDLARGAGIAVPRSWPSIASPQAPLPADLFFPVLVKPRLTIELVAAIGKKLLRADTEQELREHVAVAGALPSGYMLTEFLRGPDALLSSYNAVRSADGEILLEFTKRVDQRYPPNAGGATFHELVDLPATRDLGRRFFAEMGVIGVGNVEFKSDPDTGELKVVECNHRLTAALPMIQAAGIDLADAVYRQALGRPLKTPDRPVTTTTMWYPLRDLAGVLLSGRDRRRWLRRPWRSIRPYWSPSDPGPSARSTLNWVRLLARRLTGTGRRRR